MLLSGVKNGVDGVAGPGVVGDECGGLVSAVNVEFSSAADVEFGSASGVEFGSAAGVEFCRAAGGVCNTAVGIVGTRNKLFIAGLDAVCRGSGVLTY